MEKMSQQSDDDDDYTSEAMTAEHKDVVIDQISRSFAEKGDLTTLAEVSYEHLYNQVGHCAYVIGGRPARGQYTRSIRTRPSPTPTQNKRINRS